MATLLKSLNKIPVTFFSKVRSSRYSFDWMKLRSLGFTTPRYFPFPAEVLGKEDKP